MLPIAAFFVNTAKKNVAIAHIFCSVLIGETLQLIVPSYSLELYPFIKKRAQRYVSCVSLLLIFFFTTSVCVFIVYIIDLQVCIYIFMYVKKRELI